MFRSGEYVCNKTNLFHIGIHLLNPFGVLERCIIYGQDRLWLRPKSDRHGRALIREFLAIYSIIRNVLLL